MREGRAIHQLYPVDCISCCTPHLILTLIPFHFLKLSSGRASSGSAWWMSHERFVLCLVFYLSLCLYPWCSANECAACRRTVASHQYPSIWQVQRRGADEPPADPHLLKHPCYAAGLLHHTHQTYTHHTHIHSEGGTANVTGLVSVHQWTAYLLHHSHMFLVNGYNMPQMAAMSIHVFGESRLHETCKYMPCWHMIDFRTW